MVQVSTNGKITKSYYVDFNLKYILQLVNGRDKVIAWYLNYSTDGLIVFLNRNCFKQT